MGKDVDWTFDEKRNVPFFGSQSDLEEMKRLVTNCLAVLDEGNSVRQMVLETWLTVDYSVRQFLLSGLDLQRFIADDLDLRYDLLPGFRPCLRLLKQVVRHCQNLPPEQPKSDRAGGFKASYEFWRFIAEAHPELQAAIQEAQREFVIKQNPNLAEHVAGDGGYFFTALRNPVARMNDEWIAVAAGLDTEWFNLAEQLNTARDKAAHSFRPEDVAGKLGLFGPNIVPLTREKCLSLLGTLLGIERVGGHG